MLLRDHLMVGYMTLNHVILVRIQVPQHEAIASADGTWIGEGSGEGLPLPCRRAASHRVLRTEGSQRGACDDVQFPQPVCERSGLRCSDSSGNPNGGLL